MTEMLVMLTLTENAKKRKYAAQYDGLSRFEESLKINRAPTPEEVRAAEIDQWNADVEARKAAKKSAKGEKK
jgi:hypothetical protein